MIDLELWAGFTPIQLTWCGLFVEVNSLSRSHCPPSGPLVGDRNRVVLHSRPWLLWRSCPTAMPSSHNGTVTYGAAGREDTGPRGSMVQRNLAVVLEQACWPRFEQAWAAPAKLHRRYCIISMVVVVRAAVGAAVTRQISPSIHCFARKAK